MNTTGNAAARNTLEAVLSSHVGPGVAPGAVALVARGDEVEVRAVGSLDAEGTAPAARDSIFRIASLTKPLTAALVLTLVDEGRIALEDPVDRWLPELAAPQVVRSPAAPVDDVVPATRAITVADLLTSRAGYGFPSDFSLPAVQALLALEPGPRPRPVAGLDEWLAALAQIPLLHQPGEAWLYNTCSDLQGALVARVTGRPLDEVMSERLLEPLGMVDTAFWVDAGQLGRFASYYRTGPSGDLELVEDTDGPWSSRPALPSGAGGLVSTVDDLLAFARMLLAGGTAGGRRLLSTGSLQQLMTDHLTAEQREAGWLFLEGQGWGYGGSVDVAELNPWNVPGRYGWVGGTGTAAHLTPASGTVSILLTQVAMTGPTPLPVMRDFWRYVAASSERDGTS
ncbi:MAG: serine hydrolase domain-containing protein [Friedmanniella sp.]